MRFLIFFCLLVYLFSCQDTKSDLLRSDFFILETFEETFEIQQRTLNYLFADLHPDSLLEVKIQSALNLIDAMRKKLIDVSGGYEEGYAAEYTYTLKNKEFMNSYEVITSTFDNNEFQRTINAVSDRIMQMDPNYHNVIIFQSADDPVMREHPDWDSLKYRYYFDNFKDLNLLQSLTILQRIKLTIANAQIDYYLRSNSF